MAEDRRVQNSVIGTRSGEPFSTRLPIAQYMPPQPNILLINTHDSGRHFGCYGVDEVQTPNVDQLAENGVQLTEFHATDPQCAPSRCSLLTGQYPQRNGMMGLPSPGFEWSLNDSTSHLAHRISDTGYYAAQFGFQHEAEPADIDSLGFDSVDDSVRPGPDVATDVASFLTSYDRDDPFYAQVGLFETHNPLDFGGAEPDRENGVAIPPYLADEPTAREALAQFQGLLKQGDDAVGIILDALDTAGLRESTLVVFTSDHGIPFSRAKGYLYDAGTGVPLILHWPEGGLEGGDAIDVLASNVDFLPTLFELIGLPVPDDVDGRSFADFLDSDREFDVTDHRDAIYGMFHDHRRWGFAPDCRSIRTDRYKLIRNFESGKHFEPPINLSNLDRLGRDGLKTGEIRPPVELYDLEADPDEFENVADEPEYSDIRQRLDRKLLDHLASVDDPILRGPPPSPFADRALATFQKPDDD